MIQTRLVGWNISNHMASPKMKSWHDRMVFGPLCAALVRSNQRAAPHCSYMCSGSERSVFQCISVSGSKSASWTASAFWTWCRCMAEYSEKKQEMGADAFGCKSFWPRKLNTLLQPWINFQSKLFTTCACWVRCSYIDADSIAWCKDPMAAFMSFCFRVLCILTELNFSGAWPRLQMAVLFCGARRDARHPCNSFKQIGLKWACHSQSLQPQNVRAKMIQ